MHRGGTDPPGRGVTVIMDAGIATRNNLGFLKEQGYDYVVVSKEKWMLPQEQASQALVTVKENGRNKVEARLHNQGNEARLFCTSKMKSAKEQRMRKLFEERLAHDHQQAAAALTVKSGVKTYDKVMERFNRLIEKHKCISQ